MTHDKFYPWAKRDDFMLHLIFHEKFPHLCYNYTVMLVYLRHSSLSLTQKTEFFFSENHQSLTINVQNHLITRQKRTCGCLNLFKDRFSVHTSMYKVFLTLVEFGHVDYLLCIENMSICNPTKRLPNSNPGKGFRWKCFFYIKPILDIFHTDIFSHFEKNLSL